MTPVTAPADRIRMAKMACALAAAVLVFFTLVGKWVFSFLGITLPAFAMAASVVLLLVALDMVRAKRSAVQQTAEETAAGAEKDDIAITPLAVPMLAGPGAISTVILLNGKASGLGQHVALIGCILGVCAAAYLLLRLSARGAEWLSPIALKIAQRLMGLLLAAIAFQFFINALKELRADGVL